MGLTTASSIWTAAALGMGSALAPISRALLVTLSVCIAAGLQLLVMLEDVIHEWHTRSAMCVTAARAVFHVGNEDDVVEQHIQLV
eukprot:SAG31_NODE_98_length_25640_cov_9.936744_26_plen_85_part_00